MFKRAENEKKTITKSIKLSADMLEYIKSKANEKNMNFSRYMVDCALNRESSVTPEILCRLENIIETCMKYIDDEEILELIRREADELWDCLR